MNPGRWQWLKQLSGVLAVERGELARQEQNIVAIQRNILLPIRLLVVVFVFLYYFSTPWIVEAVTTYGVVFEAMQNIFAGYALAAIAIATVFYVVRRFPAGMVKWFVFALGVADVVFLGSLTFVTGGFESVLYWVYPGLIILNAVSIPREAPQVILNLLLSIVFLVAGLVEAELSAELALPSTDYRRPVSMPAPVAAAELSDLPEFTRRLADTNDVLARVAWARFSSSIRQRIQEFSTNRADETSLRVALADELNRISRQPRSVVVAVSNPESYGVTPGLQVLRVAVLTLLTFSVYGMQVLLARQRQVLLEQQTFMVLTERLRTAGRVAAEFAHQVKNPLAIINNVIFSLQKSAPAAAPQIEIIREEVAKCDRIITQIMGYGELSEGRIERLDVARELESAIHAVFPPGVSSGVQVRRSFSKQLPALLMQRRHLADALTNLILNAREAVHGAGIVYVSARRLEDDGLEVLIRDDGPGIPPEKVERIFEAYYTTKPKGTGLGLAIVKHNVELYSGEVRVQSELGKGAEFVLFFPGKMSAN